MPYKDLERKRKRNKERFHEDGTSRQGTLHRQHAYRRTTKGKFSYLKANAKSRNLEVTLTEQEYISVVEGAQCFYCGGILPEASYGLDRKDSSKGYTFENVVPCCHNCNKVKSDILSHEEMVAAMKVVLAMRNK